MIKSDSIKEYLWQQVVDGASPGFVCGVCKNDEQQIYSVGYKALYPYRELTEEDTLYDVASLTKVLVIVPIISKLIDQGIIKLNDPIGKYLTNYKNGDITIYELLTHSSGLPAHLGPKDNVLCPREEVIDIIYNMDKEYKTGTKVVYSDIGYILLGFMIEKIYNKSLDQVAKEEVFIPLEMTSTSYNPIDKMRCAATEISERRGIIRGEVHDEKTCNLGGVGGSAGVFSCVPDLIKFTNMILNYGKYKDKQFISKDMIEIILKPLVYEEPRNRYRSLCWIVGNNDFVIKDRDVISFHGFAGVSITIDIKNQVSIVLADNRIHPTRDNRIMAERRALIHEMLYETLQLDKDKTIKY